MFRFFLLCTLSIGILFSSGVFAQDDSLFLVYKPGTLECGMFQKGTSENPNWLPLGWQTIQKNKSFYVKYLSNPICEMGNISLCCSQLGLKFYPEKIGENSLSLERKSAEFLASKKIIEPQSFSPDLYKLSHTITRAEVSKIIMNISGKNIEDTCRGVFQDVSETWACKYIEGALDAKFISHADFFRPNDSITQTEVIKMVFQARGISKRYTTDSWQQDYISSAYYLGFIDEKTVNYTTPATRAWIFQLISKTYSDF